MGQVIHVNAHVHFVNTVTVNYAIFAMLLTYLLLQFLHVQSGSFQFCFKNITCLCPWLGVVAVCPDERITGGLDGGKTTGTAGERTAEHEGGMRRRS